MHEDVGFGIVVWSTTCLVFVLTCLVVAMAGGGLWYLLAAVGGAGLGYLPIRLALAADRRTTAQRTSR